MSAVSGGEMVGIMARLEGDSQAQLASDWGISMDLLLTELKDSWLCE